MMRWYALPSLYFLFWFLALFCVLPFGMRTAEEAGEAIETGHADSAPARFDFWLVVRRTSLVALAMTAAYWVAWRAGYLNIG